MHKRTFIMISLLVLVLAGVAAAQDSAPAAGPNRYLKTITVGAEGWGRRLTNASAAGNLGNRRNHCVDAAVVIDYSGSPLLHYPSHLKIRDVPEF
jgi:hypothetical protein